jgi:integrase
MRFTDRSIQALKPRAARYVAWKDHGDGLGVRVTPNGKKTFVYMYRAGGRSRMLSLGQYDKLSLADANAAHAKARQLVGKGGDPGEKAVTGRQRALKAPTVAQLAEDYIERWAKPRKRSWAEDARSLNKDVVPRWGRRKAADITRRDVVALLDDVVARGSPIAANRTLAVVRKMFNFAVSKDLVDTTPCTAVQAPAKENRRDRVLSEDEIHALWNGLESAYMRRPTQLALKLVLVTAQRKGEVLNARWDEIDLDTGWWDIPASKAKNGVHQRVPLSGLAVGLLLELQPLTGKSVWLFPSPRGTQPMTGEAVSRALYRNREHLGLDDVTPHDLRRTAASHISSLGVSRTVLMKILNHVDSSVTAVYDRYRYDREKRDAIEAWADLLRGMIAALTNTDFTLERTSRRVGNV